VQNTTNKVQIIQQGGAPMFAVLPYDHYLAMAGNNDFQTSLLPHPVVDICIKRQVCLIAAWRMFRGLSQEELGNLAGMTQSAVAQLERQGVRHQRRTLLKLARALKVWPDQLVD
jgi:DNA-binding XRE family transcriptional regulator